MNFYGKRRALGQHFLRDQKVVEAIAQQAIDEANRHGCPSLLEIGPGKGALTLPLLEKLEHQDRITRFTLAERDRDFVMRWQQHPTPQKLEFDVKSGDFLELGENEWLPQDGQPLAVVSNLPYSSGTAIATLLCKHYERIPVMVLMFQAEVARRLRAEVSTKDRGSLSIWVQNRWDVKKFLFVPPKAFSPPPKVDSEVVILERREKPRIEFPSTPKEEKAWESFLKGCFAQRRKMIRTNPLLQNALELAAVDGTKRPEALEWQEWDRLFQAVRQVTRLHTS